MRESNPAGDWNDSPRISSPVMAMYGLVITNADPVTIYLQYKPGESETMYIDNAYLTIEEWDDN